MNKTLELTKSLASEAEFTVLSDHTRKLEEVLGRTAVERTPYDAHMKTIESLKSAGVTWFVPTSFALKFKYHAALLGTCVGKQNWDHNRWKEVYWYAGDIPETVLDNINMVKSVIGKEVSLPLHISVHSMDVLPITVEKIPRVVDPVAIVWIGNPEIYRSGLTWKNDKNRIGGIIGIWDKEKELEIL